MSGGKSIWVLAELSEGRLEDSSFEILGQGRQLADKLGGEVSAVTVGSNSRELAETLASFGADKVYLIYSTLLLEYNAELYVEVLSTLFEEQNPEVVLFGATLIGRDLAPRLAARLKTGLVSGCISLGLDHEGLLLATKLTHGARISSTIVCPTSKPQMFTVKPGVMTAARPNPGRKPELTVITPELSKTELRTDVKGIVKADPEKISLDEADIIVSGGKGVGSKENFRLLEEMAKHLGGLVAGSLGAIDEEWLPRKKLVGQTGTTVAPKLYIACGISGSVYHVLGMKDSEFIIAINKDPGASIFKVADIGIIGDVVEVTSAIIERLRGLGPNTVRHSSG